MKRAILALVVGVCVLLGTGLASAERRLDKARAADARVDRVDMGIVLHVVRKPADGTKIGKQPRPDQILRTHHLGGMIATDRRGTRLVGPSRSPVVWLCSEAQEPLILHRNDGPLWKLIQGSEGAGKTVTLAMWLILRVLEHVGEPVEFGLTAPTTNRLNKVKKEVANLWPERWFRFHALTQTYTFHAGPSVQLVSAVQRSEAGGSPIQGDSWEGCGSDELQDHFEREGDIESRGRSARAGRYKRLCTSTAKDSTEWRNFRGLCEKSPDWQVVRMLGTASPFVDDEHWARLKRSPTMTDREYRRRVLALDVGPEKQVYFSWRRADDLGRPLNLRAIPPGARDITAEVMRPWGPSIGLLVGHDPGVRQHVSVFLKAYRLADQRDEWPRWFVVDEVTSPEATIHAHAHAVLERMRAHRVELLDRSGKRRSLESPRALVRIDPATVSGDDHPGEDVYAMWRSLDLIARAAAYKPGGNTPITIKRNSRIDMVNTLLCAKAGGPELRRLFVALDAKGDTAAPRLVEAFETMETNEAGKAERDKKDANDRSHWPAALGYALWSVEAKRLGLTLDQQVAA